MKPAKLTRSQARNVRAISERVALGLVSPAKGRAAILRAVAS